MEFKGCGDHGCLCVKPIGQGTNGGCKCWFKHPREAIRFMAGQVREAKLLNKPVVEIEPDCGNCFYAYRCNKYGSPSKQCGYKPVVGYAKGEVIHNCGSCKHSPNGCFKRCVDFDKWEPKE